MIIDDYKKLLKSFYIDYFMHVRTSMREAFSELKMETQITLEKNSVDQNELRRKMATGETLSEEQEKAMKEILNIVNKTDETKMIDIWILVRKRKKVKKLNFITYIGYGEEAVNEAKNILGDEAEIVRKNGTTYIKNKKTHETIYVYPLREVVSPFENK